MAIRLPKEEIAGLFLSDMNRLFSKKKDRNRLLVVSDTILEVIGHKPASDIDVFEEYLFTSPTDDAIRLVLEILFIFNMQIDLNILFLRNIFFRNYCFLFSGNRNDLS